jgi:hypothetical protein
MSLTFSEIERELNGRFTPKCVACAGPRVFNRSKEKGDGEERVKAVNAFRVGTGEVRASKASETTAKKMLQKQRELRAFFRFPAVSEQERAVTIIFPRLGSSRRPEGTGYTWQYATPPYGGCTVQFGTRALVTYAGFFTALRRQFGGQQAGTAPTCPAVAVARVTELVAGQEGSNDRDVTAVADGQKSGGADASRPMESLVVLHGNEVHPTAPRCSPFPSLWSVELSRIQTKL